MIAGPFAKWRGIGPRLDRGAVNTELLKRCIINHGLHICKENGQILVTTQNVAIPFRSLGQTKTVIINASSPENAAMGLEVAAAASGGKVSVKSISANEGQIVLAIELPDTAAEAAIEQLATAPGVTVPTGPFTFQILEDFDVLLLGPLDGQDGWESFPSSDLTLTLTEQLVISDAITVRDWISTLTGDLDGLSGSNDLRKRSVALEDFHPKFMTFSGSNRFDSNFPVVREEMFPNAIIEDSKGNQFQNRMEIVRNPLFNNESIRTTISLPGGLLDIQSKTFPAGFLKGKRIDWQLEAVETSPGTYDTKVLVTVGGFGQIATINSRTTTEPNWRVKALQLGMLHGVRKVGPTGPINLTARFDNLRTTLSTDPIP